jgi:hypothetical protein
MPSLSQPSLSQNDTHQKALALNLDSTIFGSFAEIGAGQEVARWFLRVGAASGTVAKTISAYDKEVSDHLYGTGTRYVSKQRLQAMLDKEWSQLLAQLHSSRGANTKFFSFVNTVSARNFAGTNDCHGWVGLRFQQEPGGQPNEIILHINLRDPSNLQQQEAIGILGVNLIYAAFHSLASSEQLLHSVFEGLELARLEVDCFDFKGPAFAVWDLELIHALLVVGGYAEAVIFPVDRLLLPPNELLYKRSMVMAPGRFESVDHIHADLIRDTLAQLPEGELATSKGGIGLYCLSISVSSTDDKQARSQEILKRVEGLRALGYGVMLFRSDHLYSMTAFANRYTKSPIRFAISLSVLIRVFEDRYVDLPGTLLEGISRLFTQNVTLVVYPMAAQEVQNRVKSSELTGWRWVETNGVITGDNLHPPGALDSLYQYLLGSGFIVPAKPRISK